MTPSFAPLALKGGASAKRLTGGYSDRGNLVTRFLLIKAEVINGEQKEQKMGELGNPILRG